MVLVYLALQLGHALDLASERALAVCRSRLLSAERRLQCAGSASRPPLLLPPLRALLALVWLLELHCLGDYYSSYWPATHPLAAAPVVCVLAISMGVSWLIHRRVVLRSWRA